MVMIVLFIVVKRLRSSLDIVVSEVAFGQAINNVHTRIAMNRFC